jgi:hypothetical protein
LMVGMDLFLSFRSCFAAGCGSIAVNRPSPPAWGETHPAG